MSGTAQLQLDKTSTPEKEAEAFENADDKKLKLHEIQNSHEINKLKLRQGAIGKFIGSGNDATLNFCLILAMCLIGIIVIFGIGIFFSIEQFTEPLRLAFTALLTITGYVFGKQQK